MGKSANSQIQLRVKPNVKQCCWDLAQTMLCCNHRKTTTPANHLNCAGLHHIHCHKSNLMLDSRSRTRGFQSLSCRMLFSSTSCRLMLHEQWRPVSQRSPTHSPFQFNADDHWMLLISVRAFNELLYGTPVLAKRSLWRSGRAEEKYYSFYPLPSSFKL